MLHFVTSTEDVVYSALWTITVLEITGDSTKQTIPFALPILSPALRVVPSMMIAELLISLLALLPLENA